MIYILIFLVILGGAAALYFLSKPSHVETPPEFEDVTIEDKRAFYFKNKLIPLMNITAYILWLGEVAPYKRRNLLEMLYLKKNEFHNRVDEYIKEVYPKNAYYIDDDIDLVDLNFDYENKMKFIKNIIKLINENNIKTPGIMDQVCLLSKRLHIVDHDFSQLLYGFNYKEIDKESAAFKENDELLPFEILEADPESEFEEIRNQYRKLVSKFHPDKYIDASEGEKRTAEEKMREINWAYNQIKKKMKK